MAGLQDDLKQKRPFVSQAEETYLNLIRTTDFLSREVAALLKAHQLSEAQYNVLRILRGAGPAGHACSEIAARLVTRDPDVTRLLDKLEARGLLARTREHADRRVVTTRITPPGLDVLERLDQPMHDTVERMLSHMAPGQLRQLTDLLEQARQVTPAAAGRAGA